jgi:hypothetical protein
MIDNNGYGTIGVINDWKRELKYSEETFPNTTWSTANITLHLIRGRTRAAGDQPPKLLHGNLMDKHINDVITAASPKKIKR